MKHYLRKFIAVSAAALTMISVLPAGIGTSEFITPITAAAATITSGQIGIEYKVSDEVTLYFYPDMNDHHMEVWGSKITGDNVEVNIPDTFTYNGEEFTVTAIRPHAFYNQTNLGSIRGSSEHITSIGQGAFYGCTNLTDLYINNRGGYSSVEYIGPCAFEGCSSLLSLGFASYTDEIGAHAFWGCTSLYNIYLYDIKTLGNAAFYNCSGADTIELSRSEELSRIPDHAFWGCSSAKEIHLPENIYEIGVQSFAGCTNFTTVNIPDNVTTIGSAAFMSCDSLRNVLMSDSIISVGDHAFFLCPNMKYFVSKNPNAFLGDYSVGWHLLDNGMPVTNDDFVVWSTGNGRVKNYAANNGLTYHDISDAASLASTRYRNFEWAKSNNATAWGNNNKYYFGTSHKPYANGYINKQFKGICNGLAVISALTSQGYLSVSDYAPAFSRIKDISADNTMPSFVKSYATTVWANSDVYSDDYNTEWETNHFGKEMMKYAENITYGADAAIFVIDGTFDKAGHAMVCFGLEFKDYASDKNTAKWNGWDARFLIYDVNRTSHSSYDYCYVNFSDGSWYCKRYLDYGYDTSKNHISLTHSYDKMVSGYSYDMTPDEFFDAIRYNNS